MLKEMTLFGDLLFTVETGGPLGLVDLDTYFRTNLGPLIVIIPLDWYYDIS